VLELRHAEYGKRKAEALARLEAEKARRRDDFRKAKEDEQRRQREEEERRRALGTRPITHRSVCARACISLSLAVCLCEHGACAGCGWERRWLTLGVCRGATACAAGARGRAGARRRGTGSGSGWCPRTHGQHHDDPYTHPSRFGACQVCPASVSVGVVCVRRADPSPLDPHPRRPATGKYVPPAARAASRGDAPPLPSLLRRSTEDTAPAPVRARDTPSPVSTPPIPSLLRRTTEETTRARDTPSPLSTPPLPTGTTTTAAAPSAGKYVPPARRQQQQSSS
jgi:hypothetical protein